jgi:hypothetical protein
LSTAIGGAKIVDHRNAETPRQGGAVADLQRQPALGPMQQRLAMKSDRGDGPGLQGVGGEKTRHRLGMRIVDQLLGLRDDRRPRRALGQVRRGGGGAAQ